MARKLYIFNVTGKQRSDWKLNAPVKWLGNYSTSYAFLGDHYAKMLGVGNQYDQRVRAWALSPNAAVTAKPVKRGASRLDRSFRGWG
ncbi:MAG: hypothetical protein JWQ71_3051 [Pedosphaera sp.]|nr:hypothetical protein [Pedosphaera sp.]